MFGYIKTCTPQLRLCEWEAYRGIYCGLCRTLGRRFGPLARLTLSYDFTFYATLEMALEQGINYFDLATADSACFPIFGAALAGVRRPPARREPPFFFSREKKERGKRKRTPEGADLPSGHHLCARPLLVRS